MNTLAYVVDKGVRRNQHPFALKYPWPAMRIGDSFLFPLEVPNARIGSRINTAGKAWGQRNGGKTFSVEWRGNGYRVWRVA